MSDRMFSSYASVYGFGCVINDQRLGDPPPVPEVKL